MIQNLNKSAQMQIDLMFAGFLFFIFFTMVYSIQTNYFENSHSNDELKLLSSSSKDLCIYFKNDLTNNNLNYQLNSTKLLTYTNASYMGIKTLNNIENFNFNFKLSNPLTDTQIKQFGFKSPKTSLSQSYSCYISNSNIINKISIEVWK